MARKRNRPYTKEDVKFVHEHYAEMTSQELAEARGLTKFQVAKIVTELRKNGVKLPKKVTKRKSAVEQYVEELGIKPKRTRRTRRRRKEEPTGQEEA